MLILDKKKLNNEKEKIENYIYKELIKIKNKQWIRKSKRNKRFIKNITSKHRKCQIIHCNNSKWYLSSI